MITVLPVMPPVHISGIPFPMPHIIPVNPTVTYHVTWDPDIVPAIVPEIAMSFIIGSIADIDHKGKSVRIRGEHRADRQQESQQEC